MQPINLLKSLINNYMPQITQISLTNIY